MNICCNNNVSFAQSPKMVPISSYKGTILKLTKSDKEKIKALQVKRANFELDLNCVQNLLSKIKITTRESARLFHRSVEIEGNIAIIDDLIKEIKINRLLEQKRRLNMNA